jgi:hypothetical protein
MASPFSVFLPNHFNHVKTHLWMIIMGSRIVMVNIVLLKILITFDSLFFMGSKYRVKKNWTRPFLSCVYTLKDFHPYNIIT